MGRQNVKLLIGMIVVSFLMGCAVLAYSYFTKGFTYSISANMGSNAEYYPNLTAELVKQEHESTQSEQEKQPDPEQNQGKE